MTARYLRTLAVVAVVMAAAFVLVGRGSFVWSVTAAALAVWIGVPLAVVAGILFWLSRRKLSLLIAAKAALAVSVIAVTPLLMHPLGDAVLASDIREAKLYCEGLAPRLETYRAAHGSYPSTVEVVTEGPLPRLLRDQAFYSAEAGTYQFSFVNPGGLMNGYQYNSSSKSWVEWR